MHTCIHKCAYIYIYICLSLSIYIYGYGYVYGYICMNVYMHVCVCVTHVDLSLYIYIYVHIYIYIYKHHYMFCLATHEGDGVLPAPLCCFVGEPTNNTRPEWRQDKHIHHSCLAWICGSSINSSTALSCWYQLQLPAASREMLVLLLRDAIANADANNDTHTTTSYVFPSIMARTLLTTTLGFL